MFVVFFLLLSVFSKTLCSEERIADLKVLWEGSFFDSHSMSYVNRSLVKELHKKNLFDFVCRNTTKGLIEYEKDINELFVKNLPFKPTVTIFQSWSNPWIAPTYGKWVVIQPWDYGFLPKSWIEPLKQVHEVWVPSEFIKKEYVDSGVSADKVVVVPNGIDPLIYHPQVKPYPLDTKKKFKFLYVGEPAVRKGFDLVLRAFKQAFQNDDDVVLVIKTLSHQMENADPCIKNLVNQIFSLKDRPEIIYIDEALTMDEMAGVYTACDCLIHPFRGEGFGLPMLEAMACGLAVIATKGGGAADFLKEDFTYFIEGEVFDIPSSIYGIDLLKQGYLIEPKFEMLVNTLKEAYANPASVRLKGKIASKEAHSYWTWEQAAEKVINRLKILSQE